MPKRNNTCPSKLLPASLPVRSAGPTFSRSIPRHARAATRPVVAAVTSLGISLSPNGQLCFRHVVHVDNIPQQLGLILVLLMILCRQAGREDRASSEWCISLKIWSISTLGGILADKIQDIPSTVKVENVMESNRAPCIVKG